MIKMEAFTFAHCISKHISLILNTLYIGNTISHDYHVLSFLIHTSIHIRIFVFKLVKWGTKVDIFQNLALCLWPLWMYMAIIKTFPSNYGEFSKNNSKKPPFSSIYTWLLWCENLPKKYIDTYILWLSKVRRKEES